MGQGNGLKSIRGSWGNQLGPFLGSLTHLGRGVRSDAQLRPTETRFQKCSQSGKNGSKHPMLSAHIV